MNTTQITRRRALTVVAGSTALAAVCAACGIVAGRFRSERLSLHEWRGTALGAPARLVVAGGEAPVAAGAIAACVAEIDRLEDEFSLYRPNSALSRLNRNGVLERPSLDMRVLLGESLRIGRLSDGAFDVSVQPLWRLYADFFSAAPQGGAADADGPSEAAVAEARTLVDFRRVRIDAERVTLAAGMALTLNGIAQGYITDRIADLLRARGWHNLLIDLGEIRGLGTRPDGLPWTVKLARPAVAAEPLPLLALANRAIATSAASATVFEPSGRSHHLFSPQTGRSAGEYAQVSVVASRAVVADALSTALYVMPRRQMAKMLGRFPGIEAIVVDRQGVVQRWSNSA
jgi:thiamine biosynthesis lipoprotein